MESPPNDDTLANMLDEAGQQVEINALYEHYKGGMYKVLDLAIAEKNIEVSVVYQAQYGRRLKFIRVVSVWLEDVEYEGRTVPRFAKITPSIEG